jgi:hypothetical protein
VNLLVTKNKAAPLKAKISFFETDTDTGSKDKNYAMKRKVTVKKGFTTDDEMGKTNEKIIS